ncbi:hypothetical protein B7463_g3469, partial [Scytalidium lignicola]
MEDQGGAKENVLPGLIRRWSSPSQKSVNTLTILLLCFFTFGGCWLQPEDDPFNSLLPPPGWRLGNRALLARQSPAPCDPEIIDPDTPDCRTLCGGGAGPCAGGAALKRRDLRIARQPAILNSTDLPSKVPNELWKRVFTDLTQDQLPAYLVDQFDGNPDAGYGTPISIIPPENSVSVQRNVVVQRSFAKVPFAIGTNGLCGCTVVTVASTQAVYMGHFFENPSWTNSAATFTNSVLNFFGGNVNGAGTGPQINPDLFGAEVDTRVYIMTPRRGKSTAGAGSPLYRGKVPQLISAIQVTLGDDVPLALFNYTPLECDEDPGEDDSPPNPDLFTSQRGVALFQFDPQADEDGKPGWRLFYEHHQFTSSGPAPGPDAVNGIPS